MHDMECIFWNAYCEMHTVIFIMWNEYCKVHKVHIFKFILWIAYCKVHNLKWILLNSCCEMYIVKGILWIIFCSSFWETSYLKFLQNIKFNCYGYYKVHKYYKTQSAYYIFQEWTNNTCCICGKFNVLFYLHWVITIYPLNF